MSLLSYNEINKAIDDGIIESASRECINSASLDIHLGHIILAENPHISQGPEAMRRLDKKDQLSVEKIDISGGREFVLAPGQFVLAQSREIFHLPSWLSAEYKLKSSMARLGLEHMNAGWCDAGWNGSVLTLELKNITQYHRIVLKEGDRIGQMIFFAHAPVPEDKSYAVRGSYNGDKQTTGVKTS